MRQCAPLSGTNPAFITPAHLLKVDAEAVFLSAGSTEGVTPAARPAILDGITPASRHFQAIER